MLECRYMGKTVRWGRFEWDEEKSELNKKVHGLDFKEATEAFRDPDRVVAVNERHSQKEQRFYLMGLIKGRVATIRFTYREPYVRLIGAGYWRKGRKLYEKENKKRFR